jgi:hypothetical protein
MFITLSCTDSKVSFDTAEDARRQARENASITARDFRSGAGLVDLDIVMRGDSTIDVRCPQGDGWASVDLIDRNKGETIKLKCSTVSLGIGCLTEADFKKRTNYANQDGSCSNDIPFPLPKLVK